jgi:hypothetical protein
MSTPRLPIPGGDNEAWGTILNEYLTVEHDSEGRLKKSGIIDGAEQQANKGVALGYPALGADGVVPDAQLPVYISNTGNYLSLSLYGQDLSEGSNQLIWNYSGASRGLSVTWDADQPHETIINDPGVYAISLTVDWGDSLLTDDGHRGVGLHVACGFYTMDRRRPVLDGSGTRQIVQFISFLQAGHDITAALDFGGTPMLSPNVDMLVTLISGTPA